MERLGSKVKSSVVVVEKGKGRSRLDHLATEEPLEIRLTAPQRTIAITMRTPGADFDLAEGFLYNEGIISNRTDLLRLSYCIYPDIDGSQRYNIVNVELNSSVDPDLQSLERYFCTTSACGVCGKARLEALKIQGCEVMDSSFKVPASVIDDLPEKLRSHQGIFTETGGLHAAALFDGEGNLLAVQEDVGRHNALDKLVGSAFLAGTLSWRDRIVMVSGRSSFEILQKSLRAGAPHL